MLIKSLFITLIFLLSACDRDTSVQTASLTINNMTDLRVSPQKPLSIWSLYVTPTASTTPALDRSIDLLASEALKAGVSQSFSITTCGQLLDIQVILSDGSEQVFTSTAAVDCNTTFSQDVL